MEWKNDIDENVRSGIVELLVHCNRSMKSVFLNELKEDIANFTEFASLITKDNLYKEFGTPDEISDGLLDRNDYNILFKKAKIFPSFDLGVPNKFHHSLRSC